MNFLLTYRNGIGWALGATAATVTVVVFQVVFGFSWMIAVPVAVLAYVTAPVMWTRYIHSIQTRQSEPPG